MPVRPSLPPIAESRGAPPRSVRDLVAVLYRQAGLIALCALVGGGVALVVTTLRQPGGDVDVRVQAVAQDRPLAATPRKPVAAWLTRAGHRLKLDLEPGSLRVARGASALIVALEAQAPRLHLRLDAEDADERDNIDLYDRPLTTAGRGHGVALTGLVAGLLLGLLLAALRELGGARMRTPRQAQWALGAPVLGAIPTLSAKARNTCFEPTLGAPDAAPSAPA